MGAQKTEDTTSERLAASHRQRCRKFDDLVLTDSPAKKESQCRVSLSHSKYHSLLVSGGLTWDPLDGS